MAPLALAAQETQKEVHIKIVEDGVVTMDTMYTTTSDLSEIEQVNDIKMHHGHMYCMEEGNKHECTMNDSTGKNFERGQVNERMRREVRVVVRAGEEENSEVEEIWLDEPCKMNKPCRTIIIHEGNCPGNHMKMDVRMHEGDGPEHFVPPPPPPHGKGPANTKTKVVKTEGGRKVMVIETTDDQPLDSKEKSKE